MENTLVERPLTELDPVRVLNLLRCDGRGDASAPPRRTIVSVLPPVGSALLGLRVDGVARWSDPCGDEEAAESLAILRQPASRGDPAM